MNNHPTNQQQLGNQANISPKAQWLPSSRNPLRVALSKWVLSWWRRSGDWPSQLNHVANTEGAAQAAAVALATNTVADWQVGLLHGQLSWKCSTAGTLYAGHLCQR